MWKGNLWNDRVPQYIQSAVLFSWICGRKGQLWVDRRVNNTRIQRNWEIGFKKVVKIIIQFNSTEVDLLAETTAVWPKKGRETNDQNKNTKEEIIQ